MSLLLLALVVLAAAPATAADPTPGECSGAGGASPSRCLYRSMLPSAGLVAECESDARCRVGYYAGSPTKATWLAPPRGLATLPKPRVIWHSATFAEARFDCGRSCSVSYFFEARRHFISQPRWFVLDVDLRRQLLAAAEERALVVRQIFSGREVARIERPWSQAAWLGDVVTTLRFDPDGRLSFTWLRGSERAPVSERVSIPSIPR
ncbi:MAG: hypothetical protein Q8Q58_08550 [Candidatus Rokubacteria bacterium]|nr:hypothetical protein [Candidatus Rokubacteria bacterium]